MTAPWNNSLGPRPLTKDEMRMGEGRPAALEQITEPLVAAGTGVMLHYFKEPSTRVEFTPSPTLRPGDTADMWHEGTKKYYRVTIQHQVTEEEAAGGV